jgi:hypothetical protein
MAYKKIFLPFFLLCYSFFLSNVFSQSQTSPKDIEPISKNWQIKIGYSLNNKNVFNIEGGYLIPLSRAFAFVADARLYSFLTVSPSLATQPIVISDKISFSLKFGLGFIFFGPVSGLTDVAFELGGLLRYQISKDYNIVFEYKQISKNSHYEGFETFSPKQMINNFPIRFISIGVEF